MAVVRRDILSDPDVRDAYIKGLKLLKQKTAQEGDPGIYDVFVIWHHRAMMTMTPPESLQGRNAAHSGPAFLPWHRYMMIVLEKQLQRVLGDSNFGLPYWSWTTDGDKPAAEQRESDLWAEDCMGGGGAPVASGPFRYDEEDPATWRVLYESGSSADLRRADRGLIRAFDWPTALPTTAAARTAVEMTPYDIPPWDDDSDSFRNRLEGFRPGPDPGLHNAVHVWIGGDMGIGTSPNDPVFYLNHANVDRMWSAWQQKHGDATYVPGVSAPVVLKGHRLNDRLNSPFASPPKIAEMLDVSEIYSYDTVSDLM
jgi:tyrosinase